MKDDIAISVEHLSKSYIVEKKEEGLTGTLKNVFARKHETVKAVKDISFAIEKGELVGFIGPNGAGKTTTLKTLSGLLYPTSGDVSVLGFKPWERKKEFLKQIALVMGQKNQLWWDLPAVETFRLNKEIYDISDDKYKKTLKELAELLDVAHILNTQVRKLSLGQRMKLELIAALLHTPKILYLDEPTIGLDVVMQKTIREFIKEYNQKYNATILLTSHYMNDVKELCKRVIIIDHGTIVFDGKLDQILKKYADHKRVVITLEKQIPEKEIASIAPLESYTFPTVTMQASRKDILPLTTKLMKDLPITDLTIEEIPIEEVIRNLFSSRTYDFAQSR